MSLLPARQVAAFQRGIATADAVLPQLEYLDALTQADPSLGPRVKELRDRRDFLRNFCQAALDADRIIGQRYGR